MAGLPVAVAAMVSGNVEMGRVKDAEKIVILNVGDKITFVVDKNATGAIIAVNSVK